MKFYLRTSMGEKEKSLRDKANERRKKFDHPKRAKISGFGESRVRRECVCLVCALALKNPISSWNSATVG